MFCILRFTLFFVCLACPLDIFAAEKTPSELQGVGIQEKLGTQVSLDTPFQNEMGEPVTFGSFFKQGRPVILALVYYECPNICHYLLQGFTESLANLEWKAGDQFEVVTVSIDPKETSGIALRKKESQSAKSWHFLVGKEASIEKLAGEIGFKYRYDKEQKQYAHAAGIFLLTPEGKLARVLHGIRFSKRDLKLALVEAAEGKIGTIMDRLLLYCYRYDPKTSKYGLFASNLMKGGGAAIVLLLAGLIWKWNRKNI